MSTNGGGLYDKFSKAITNVITAYKEAHADGKLSFTEIIALLGTAIGELVSIAEAFYDGSGDAKKAAVMAAIDTFYEEVIKPIDIPVIPNFIEPIADKAVKQLLLVVADGLVDAVVAIFNKAGWPDTPDTPDTPDDPTT